MGPLPRRAWRRSVSGIESLRGSAATEAISVVHAACPDPFAAQRRQALSYIEPLRPAGVVDPERRLAARERDLSHGYADPLGPFEVHLGGVGKDSAKLPPTAVGGRPCFTRRVDRGVVLRVAIASRSVNRSAEASAGARDSRAPRSLRRYQPDQVPRVTSQSDGELGVLALGYGLWAIPFKEQPIAHSE